MDRRSFLKRLGGTLGALAVVPLTFVPRETTYNKAPAPLAKGTAPGPVATLPNNIDPHNQWSFVGNKYWVNGNQYGNWVKIGGLDGVPLDAMLPEAKEVLMMHTEKTLFAIDPNLTMKDVHDMQWVVHLDRPTKI